MTVTAGSLDLVLGHALAVSVLYAIAHRAVRVAPAGDSGAGGELRAGGSIIEPVCRTALIALNAAANFALLTWLGMPLPPAAGLAFINLAAVAPRIASSPVYASLLGWSSLAMPMSWPATGTGLLVFTAATAAGAFGRPFALGLDVPTLTLVVRGGVLYAFPCGYNLGNVVFVHRRLVDEHGACAPGLVAHETGHTLNVAAFGSVFHFVGAAHQNWGPPRGGARHHAYAELWAESRRRDPSRPWLVGWAEAGTA